jgi:mRNA-degrading endonuclease RelE of RelBE toxin-antitoxin system
VPEIGDLSIREVHVRGYRVMHFVTDDKAEIEILAIHHSAQQFGSVEMDDP